MLVLSRFRLFYIAVAEVVSVDFLPSARRLHHFFENFLVSLNFSSHRKVPTFLTLSMTEWQNHRITHPEEKESRLHACIVVYIHTEICLVQV